MDRVQGYIKFSIAMVNLGYIHGASAFATPPRRHLIGWVDRFEVCYYYPHIVGSWGGCCGGLFPAVCCSAVLL